MKALVIVALLAPGNIARADDAKLLDGHAIAKLPAGWHVEGKELHRGRGVHVRVMIMDRGAEESVRGAYETAFDDGYPMSKPARAPVGGLAGWIAASDDPRRGALYAAAETCMGTFVVDGFWEDDAHAAGDEVKAIVGSLVLRADGRDWFAGDDAYLALTPSAKKAVDAIARSICVDARTTFASMAATTVRVRGSAIGVASLAAQLRGAASLADFVGMPSGPWLLAARDDGSIDVMTLAASDSVITLRKVNGAWSITRID